MKSKLVVVIGIMVSIVFLCSGIGLCQQKVSGAEWTQIIEQMGDKGKINWSEGYIEAVGIGAPPERYIGKPQARPMALRAAQVDAYRNLLEVTKGVRIDSETLVKDFTVESDIIKAQVEGLVKGAKVFNKEYMSDGTVEVTVRMPIAGGFSRVIAPKTLEKRQAAPTPTAPQVVPQAEPPVVPQFTPPVEPPVVPQFTPPVEPPVVPQVAPPVEPPAVPQVVPQVPPPVAPPAPSVVYTGMVVDARGIQARPAMSPRILDENGKEVYGSMNVDREYAIQQGMTGYARDLTAAQTNQRVTNNPISIKGVKTEGAGRSDIIISNADAEMIRSAADNLSFLKKCRVMVVLD